MRQEAARQEEATVSPTRGKALQHMSRAGPVTVTTFSQVQIIRQDHGGEAYMRPSRT